MENPEILVLIDDVMMKILDNVENKDVDLDKQIINKNYLRSTMKFTSNMNIKHLKQKEFIYFHLSDDELSAKDIRLSLHLLITTVFLRVTVTLTETIFRYDYGVD